MKIEFSEQLKEIVDKNNIQVASIDLLDEEIRKLFFKERKKAILIIKGKVYHREVDALGSKTIDIFDTELSNFIKLGELVLVIFSAESAKRYVMQTQVTKLFIDRFRLKIMDPRLNIRFTVNQNCQARMWSVPHALALAMQSGQVKAVREQDELGAANKIIIADLLYNGEKISSDYKSLLDGEGEAAKLVDISLGGACLLVAKNEQLQTNQLIFVEIIIEPHQEPCIVLLPLAVIRNSLEAEQGLRLHLRFISRLAPEFERHFKALINT